MMRGSTPALAAERMRAMGFLLCLVPQALEPMSIEGLPSYGGYVPVVRPGIYRIRFEARGVGIAGVASAEFEHRIAGEGGGR